MKVRKKFGGKKRIFLAPFLIDEKQRLPSEEKRVCQGREGRKERMKGRGRRSKEGKKLKEGGRKEWREGGRKKRRKEGRKEEVKKKSRGRDRM